MFLVWRARAETLSLSPIYEFQINGVSRLESVVPTNAQMPTIRFFAIVTNSWPSGFAPIFAVEVNEKWELRRRPARGQENFTEPLFFALPPVDETNVSRINGRWECRAVSEEGQKTYPPWELALEGERIAGRFDQNTDYRFAFITAGVFRADHLQLQIEYIKEIYELEGQWQAGKLRGKWKRSDGTEQGTWEGERPPQPDTANLERLSERKLVPIYEWRRSSDGVRQWGVNSPSKSGWSRSERPLCRVWKPL